MSDSVLLERAGAVALLTLNRPDKANVLDLETSLALIDRVERLAVDAGVRAVLLRARGRHFCAGGNIADFASSGAALSETLGRTIPPLHRALHTLATLPLPVVSALNGPVGGGGIGLALCADIVLAAESMKLRGGYTAIGLTPDVGSSWLLARRVGSARAKEIFLTNEPLDAHQCLAIGAVSQVHADDRLEARALELVGQLAAGATGAFARTKALLDAAAWRTLAAQLDAEHRAMVESGASVDAGEGVRAFIDKRKPVFMGR